MIPFPDNKYNTIYIDPPWPYNRSWDKGSDKCALKESKANISCPFPYSTLTLDMITNLPINNIANDNCELYVWVTQKYLPFIFTIIESWDFKYCQILTWCKKPRGIGQGGLFCPTTEFLILGRKGKMPKFQRIDTTWWEIKRQSKHSKKPDFFRKLIEIVTLAPRIELFARQETEGWDVWGNEV